MDRELLIVFTLIKLITAQNEGLFKSVDGLRVATAYQKIAMPQPRKTFCAKLCMADLLCVSASFNKISLSCELSVYHPASIESGVSKADDWTLMYKTNGLKDKWTRIFRGTARIGVDVVESFIGTNSLPKPDSGCFSWDNSACNTHVRSSWIDKWTDLNIKEVKVEFLTNGQTVAYVVFQNRATDDKTTWFSPGNLLNSSWTDLPLTNSNYGRFRLERSTGTAFRRSFVIYETRSGCGFVEGWMFVLEVSGSWYCTEFEDHNPRPIFLYSTELTSQVWSSGPGIADVMLISIMA